MDFEPINLDGQSEKELSALQAALTMLASYCENKRHAMYCRSAGMIESALTHEGVCEQLYASLPTWAKW